LAYGQATADRTCVISVSLVSADNLNFA
jgi:hypothetical protein